MSMLSLAIPGVVDVEAGRHFCALYSSPAQRDRFLYLFIEEGLRRGDKCLCLIDDVDPELVHDRAVGPPGPDHARRSAQLDVERSSDVYLRDGEFCVDDMLSFLCDTAEAAVADDFDRLSAVGEMSWVFSGAPDWDDLFVYESSLNHVVEQVPAVLMCLYDLRKFGTDMLVEVLHTHPQVLLDGTVIDNPLYVDARDYLVAAGAAAGSRRPSLRADVDRGGRAEQGWASLTVAELRVVSLVARGMSNRAVAAHLGVSPHTVDAHLKHVYLKLDVHSRVQLTVVALQRPQAAGD